MSDIDRDQNEPVLDNTEPGFLHIEEEPTEATPVPPVVDATIVKSTVALPAPSSERVGTVEHLAARRPVAELDPDTPTVKQRLATLRAEWTRLVTGLRWEGISVKETTERMIPLLNVGSIEQWKTILPPFLYEIDRGGALIPAWLAIIERGDPPDLSPETNPAETLLGRARRFSILMLGNYKMMGIAGLDGTSQRTRTRRGENSYGERDLTEVLGDLAVDPNTSLYATQALVKHATVPAIQELIRALRYAKGWAKVDVVLGCLELKQEQFHDLLIASGLDDAPGLESYLATPLYRAISLEPYLLGDEKMNLRLIQQAALIFSQILQDSQTPPAAQTESSALPIVFERPLPTLARALFSGAQREPLWQNIVALHRLGSLLGRYWSEISQGKLRDGRIVEPIYHCLPMMNDVEYWIHSTGRDVLLKTLESAPEETLTPVIKVLGDLRDPRTSTPLMARLETISTLQGRQHALMIGTMCETLGQFGDRRALATLQHLVERTINLTARKKRSLRRDNLPLSDPDVPASIVYAAAMRTCGQLADKAALDFIYPATKDFDPYVRSQTLEAIRRIDPRGEDPRSRTAARELVNDPRESVARSATQMIVQYRDLDAISLLRQLSETRSDLAYLAQDALRQLGQYTGT